MKLFTNSNASKQIFSTLLLVITSIGIAHAEPSAFERSSIEGQITNFRSTYQSCQGWWYLSANSVFLNNEANEVAQYYSDYMANHGGSAPSENIQTMLNDKLNSFVAIETKTLSSNQTNHQTALAEWMNTYQACTDIMITGQSWAGIGVGKSQSPSGQFYWTLIIFKQARASFLVDPVIPSQILNFNVSQSFNEIDVKSATIYTPNKSLPRSDADLIITGFEKIGNVTKVHDKFYEVAVRAVVENQGTEEAKTFRIGTWGRDSSTLKAIPFTVPGQTSTRKPLTSTKLYPGETITIDGKLSLHPALTGRKIKLIAIADDCSNINNADYCEVYEADEENNESEVLSFDNPYTSKFDPDLQIFTKATRNK